MTDSGVQTKIVLHSGVENGGMPDPELDKVFSFEKVLDPNTDQAQVFEFCEGKSLSNSFLNG